MKSGGIWAYPSFRAFSREAAGKERANRLEITPGRSNVLPLDKSPSPVIVAVRGVLPSPFPMLEGRNRQPLPRVPGRWHGALLAGRQQNGNSLDCRNEAMDDDSLEAWLVPWRAALERSMVITLKPGTDLAIDVSKWPKSSEYRKNGYQGAGRRPILRRAGRVLELAPDAFSTAASTSAAYRRLEEVWNDPAHERYDPVGELLAKHARKLRGTLDDLGSRPRAVLRTEYRMLKLQDVRRIDAKTLRWFSAQPGRNTAERAGARQRVKAPKRYESIATLENRVLRAFASLTVREAKAWLAGQKKRGTKVKAIEAHELRAMRIETALRARRVPEAIPPVEPNFPLRFDQRYREVWRAWQELRARSMATELEWMWQQRTFMELLALRASMKLHEARAKRAAAGSLAHMPVLRAVGGPTQGCYLHEAGIRCTLGVVDSDSIRTAVYTSGEDDRRLGAVAAAGPGTEVWWDALNASDTQDPSDRGVAVGELPWSKEHAWDASLSDWAARILSE